VEVPTGLWRAGQTTLWRAAQPTVAAVRVERWRYDVQQVGCQRCGVSSAAAPRS